MASASLTRTLAVVSILGLVAAGSTDGLATSATNYGVDEVGGENGTDLLLRPSLSLPITPLALMSKHGGGTSGGGSKHQEDVSPVTLSTEWPRLARLLLLASLSVIGSVGNVFMISSVMIEDHLKKAGKQVRRNVNNQTEVGEFSLTFLSQYSSNWCVSFSLFSFPSFFNSLSALVTFMRKVF